MYKILCTSCALPQMAALFANELSVYTSSESTRDSKLLYEDI